MPRVPTYESNAVAPARTTEARFSAPNMAASGLGAGLQDMAKALGERAETLIDIEKDEGVVEANRLDTTLQKKQSELRRLVRDSRGTETEAVIQQADAELARFQAELLGSATNPYAKKALPEIFAKRGLQERDNWLEHGAAQKRAAKEAGHVARSETSLETALDFDPDSEAAVDNLTTGLAEIAELYGPQGAGVVEQKQLAFKSRYHGARVSQLFAAEKPEEAQAYIDTHRRDMSAGDEEAARSLVRGELLANRDAADGALIVGAGGAAAVDADTPPPPAGEAKWHPPIRQRTVTVRGGEPGAPRSYGGHSGRDYAGVAEGTPVYPMAEGTIKRVYRTKGGGNTVEIKYADGSVSTYKHLKDGSTANLREGQPVEVDDIVGAVGNTGSASRGAHLHGELLTRDGKRVDPAKMTNRPAPSAPPPDGRRVDLPGMYKRIDDQPWSESRKRRVKEWVQRYAGENDQVKAREEQDADRAITQRIVEIEKGGGKLTKLSQLPPEALKRASPGTVATLLNTIEANNRPEPPAAHGDIAISLKAMAATDPEGFKKVDLIPLRGQMTPGEFDGLVQDQVKIRNAPPSASPLANIRSRIDATIERSGKLSGIVAKDLKTPEGRGQYSRMTDLMREYLRRATEDKREPTDDELDAAYDYATMDLVTRKPGTLWGQSETRSRLYEAPASARGGAVVQPGTAVAIPNDVLARIRTEFRGARGRDPDSTETLNIYLRNKGKPGFWR